MTNLKTPLNQTPYQMTPQDWENLEKMGWGGEHSVVAVDVYKETALESAIREDSVEMAHKLLRAGSQTKQITRNYSALQCAVTEASENVLKLLMDWDCQIQSNSNNTHDSQNLFHIFSIGYYHSPPVLNILLESKFSLDLKDVNDVTGFDAMMSIMKSGEIKVKELRGLMQTKDSDFIFHAKSYLEKNQGVHPSVSAWLEELVLKDALTLSNSPTSKPSPRL